MHESKSKTSCGNDVFIRIHPDDALSQVDKLSRPTAVLFGWLSSSSKNVRKYASLYEALGYNTVHSIAPHHVVFPLTEQITINYMLSVMRILVKDERLIAGGVVFQMFSNGGAIVAPDLARLIDGKLEASISADDGAVAKKVGESISAVVFDSSPVRMDVDLAVQAICEGMGMAWAPVLAVVTVLFSFVLALQRMFVRDIRNEFWSGLQAADYKCPEWYIYSKVDHLLHVEALEKLLAERKSGGREVRVTSVRDAGHVQILRKHADLYEKVLGEVLENGVNVWRRRQGLERWAG